MAQEQTINHNFDWNKDPSFFLKQEKEEEKITLGPNLSWPLMSKPESDEVEQIRSISEVERKAA